VADLASHIANLQTDFQGIADRAPWVRAGFAVKAGSFGCFGLGRDGPTSALVRGVRDSRELAIITQLYALTEQAGALVAEICQSGSFQWNFYSGKPVHYDLREPREYWLVLLLHTFPACFHCRTYFPDGKDRIAFPQLGDCEIAVRIDSYPQVCVSVLAWLKANSPAFATKKVQKKRNCNDPRDRFCYTSLKNGESLKWIMQEVNKRKKWESLSTEQAVSQAAKRYAERKELPWPLN
jgi:hypothetical protein